MKDVVFTFVFNFDHFTFERCCFYLEICRKSLRMFSSISQSHLFGIMKEWMRKLTLLCKPYAKKDVWELLLGSIMV